MVSAVMPTYARAQLSFVKGEGVWLTDEQGRRYMDLGGGIAVNSLGHCHPKLVAALNEQANAVWHTSNLYDIPAQKRLAELLVDLTFADTVFFANSGTEAMEGAVKCARKYHAANGQPERYRIITFEGSFHGRTMAMLSAAKNPKHMDGFGPMAEGFDQVALNQIGGDIEAVTAAISDETAAVVIEPVQGEGGIRCFDTQFLRDLRALCDEHGILLILDEVQTGVGRTGKLFAHENAGITPDVMAVAKGIGGGFPLGAVLATEKAASGMVPGTHGSTYGGNPLACAVGAAVVEEVTSDGFLDHVSRVAGHARQKLEGLVAAHPDVFTEIRGEGLMLGIGCKVPNMDVVNAGYDQGVLLVPAGDNVTRLLPPLNITEAEIDDGIARIDAAATAIEAKLS